MTYQARDGALPRPRAAPKGRARTWGRQPAKPAGWGHLHPDGHTRTQLYDDLGRITSRCYEYSGPTTRCYTAQYDAVGNPVQMVDPDGTDTFEYDALDRLKKVTRVASGVTTVEDYDYNGLGALKVNAGVALAHQRPRLDGNGNADAAVPATAGGQPVTLDPVGRVTSLRGTSFTWSGQGFLRQAQDPIPAAAELYGIDSNLRRTSKTQAGAAEVYVFEGLDRVATLGPTGAVKEGYLFDGIDHPLRIKIASPATTAYYELDLAGNVRGLRASGGASLGGYRYSAFGTTLEDTSSITQPLRWKGRWFSSIGGGTYDVRARQWSPELGVFLVIDGLEYHGETSTLWGWPGMNPLRWSDPSGNIGADGTQCKPETIVPCHPAFENCRPAPPKPPSCRQRNASKCAPDYEAAKRACLGKYEAEGLLDGPAAGQYEDICNKVADRAFDQCLAKLCP